MSRPDSPDALADPKKKGAQGPDQDDQDDEANNAAATAPAPVSSRTPSRASAAPSRPLTIVPVAKRRGIFARFCLVPEVERPYDYSNKTKWTITLIVALAAAVGPLGSNLLYRKSITMATRDGAPPEANACHVV